MIPGSIETQDGDDAHSPPGTSPTRVFIVDDHELIRRGLRDLIQFEDDLAVIGEADSVMAAVRGMTQHPPQVALVDLLLTDGTGIDVCRWVRSNLPHTACLMITSLDDTTALHAAITAGAVGYLPKLTTGAALVEAIRRVVAGESLLDLTLLATGYQHLREACAINSHLTDEDRRLFGLVLDGLTDRQIAQLLHLTDEAVRDRVRLVVDKIELIKTQATVRVPQPTSS
jgi:two-component system, NarL family, response regulator DevR